MAYSGMSSMEALTRVAVALLQPEVDEYCSSKKEEARGVQGNNDGGDGWIKQGDAGAGDGMMMVMGDTESCSDSSKSEELLGEEAIEEGAELPSEDEETMEDDEIWGTGGVSKDDAISEDEEMSSEEEEEEDEEEQEGGYSMTTAPHKANKKSQYWLDPSWVPTDRQGRAVKPDEIRRGLMRFLKQTDMTKTAFLLQLGVNANSFNKFVNKNAYVGDYNTRAMMNSTYLKGAQFLEAERHKGDGGFTSPVATAKTRGNTITPAMEHFRAKVNSNNKKKNQLSHGKVKVVHKKTVAFATPCKERQATVVRKSAIARMKKISRFHCDEGAVSEHCVYDSPSQIAQKIRDFLEEKGVSHDNFCSVALGGVNRKSLKRFLASKKRSSVVYGRAWEFFEKQRLLHGQRKTRERMQNERKYPNGFSRTTS